jgi:hypothetical protein
MSAAPAYSYEIHANSVFDFDYLNGNILPKGNGGADRIIESFQAIYSLDTLTGEVSGLQQDSAQPYLQENLIEWYRSKEDGSLWSLLKSAQEGKVSERVAPRASFEPLQEWEGYVTSVEGQRFGARLLDLTANQKEETEAVEFSFDDTSEDDLALIEVGAIFRWSIGYEKKVSGVRQKISSIVFRRLPIWTSKEIGLANERARHLMGQIEWD